MPPVEWSAARYLDPEWVANVLPPVPPLSRISNDLRSCPGTVHEWHSKCSDIATGMGHRDRLEVMSGLESSRPKRKHSPLVSGARTPMAGASAERGDETLGKPSAIANSFGE